MITYREALTGAAFLTKLPAFLRHSLQAPEAKVMLRSRIEGRRETFLRIFRQAIYQQPHSPYLQLLRLAGCAYGDLERLVQQEGVEGTLLHLYREGVYLTVDEFKGRCPAVRGHAAVEVTPEALRNPLAAFHVPAQTGGSRSRGTPVLLDLDFIRGCGANACLVLEARGGSHWQKGIWETPGAGARLRLLEFSSFGTPPVRWFSQVALTDAQLPPIFRWSERALRWGSSLAGVPMPRPLHTPLADPLPIAHWMTEVLQSGGVPHLFTFPSSAVRLCQAAFDRGIDLGGAHLLLSGEPITAARLATIHRTGAEVLPRYGSVDCGPMGYGCLAPEAPDDVHLLHDLHAFIQPHLSGRGENVQGRSAAPLFLSSLHPAAPFIMVNVSLGDQAEMVQRACGCPLQILGWGTHLHTIRSYEKLTGGGMTFFDTDVIRVLDEVLPARFGGVPTDYQLLEEEAGDGRPRLRLVVHPRLGPLNADAITECFLTAIGSTSTVEQMMSSLWRDAKVLYVDRRIPQNTDAGKILHLHLNRIRTG
jgi:hypothetical protein